MGLPVTIIIPDFFPYLAAVLGLLLIWQYHDRQAKAGRIVATDFWDRDGSRFFILMTPLDGQTCPHCAETRGRVLLRNENGPTSPRSVRIRLDAAVWPSVSMAPGRRPGSCWNAWTWPVGWTDCN